MSSFVFLRAYLIMVALVTSAASAAQQSNSDAEVEVWRTVLDSKTVADAFGRRISQRYIGIQVAVANRHPELHWLIHDVSLDLRPLLEDGACAPPVANVMAGRTGQPGEELDRRPAPITRLSAIDLPLLQGVVEKGQNLDPRNIVLRAMSAAGTVAAGVLGITVLPKTYSQAVASFNGPVLTALSASLPDFTTNQLMRLNQTAFAPNTLVASRQSKLMVVFVPQALLLNEHQRKLFRFAPSALWPCVDLRRIQVWVDGSYIREVGR